MRTLLLLGVLLCAACATNPVTGKRQLSFYSEAQEIELGRQELERAKLETGFYPDTALQSYVASVGMKLARLSERPGLPWEFHVIDDPAVNAFAAPGGFIFITRGIMAYLNSEAELAGVMGHEVGHVTARHSVSSGSIAQVYGGLATVASVLVDPEIVGTANQVASLGMLSYSRSHESQSDQLGHRYALQAGYDVRQMPQTFRTLERLSELSAGSSGKLPTFLSSHPDPGDRVEKTQGWADTITNTAVLHDYRDRYLEHINGLLFGVDPEQGYFDGARFLHPGMRIRFDVPQGWQTANQATQVLAVDPEGKAQIALTLASEATPAAAAQSFLNQSGVRSTGSRQQSINGLSALMLSFTTTTAEGQQLQGEVALIQSGGQVYQFLGLALAASWPALGSVIDRSLRSFASTAANQQFRRRTWLRVITLNQPITIEALARQSNGAITPQLLAVLNGVAEGTTLPAGRKVKTVSY